MEQERIVIFGASNARGRDESRDLNYYSSNLLKALYDRNPHVSVTDQEIVFDLREKPYLAEGDPIYNKGISGNTVPELLHRFPRDVLELYPSKVFIWPALNDIELSLSAWEGKRNSWSRKGPDYRNPHGMYLNVVDRCESIDEALEAISDTIFGYIGRMISLSLENHITPVIGTIPPFGSLLSGATHPYWTFRRTKGSRLIEIVNAHIVGSIDPDRGVYVADVYNALVDEATGLQKPQFSYGTTHDREDVLHLNDEGQMMVVAVLCHVLFKRTVKFLSPTGREISWGYQT